MYFCGDFDLCLIMSDISYDNNYYNNILLKNIDMHFKHLHCAIRTYLPLNNQDALSCVQMLRSFLFIFVSNQKECSL
jgi:hypothetical protein